MTAFAYYRLPHEHHCTYLEQEGGEPEVFTSIGSLNGKEGFVIAPFSPSASSPILLMHPDKVNILDVKESQDATTAQITELHTSKEVYQRDFDCFHAPLRQGIFKKIVLAKCSQAKISHLTIDEDKTISKQSAEALFMRTCLLYPRLFIALVHTQTSGTWLMATPEILLSGNGKVYKTMALAGTQQAPVSEWSDKNKEEQQYVTDYIEEVLSHFTNHCEKKGPFTTMAAKLYHLRTDFTFQLQDDFDTEKPSGYHRLGDVLEALFPTPAVCGIPKETTRQFILSHESIDRKYYSGFVGPISPSGMTELYVSLRCMNLFPDGTCHLYAGGGLLKSSEADKEWEETEAKLQTMKKVLAPTPPTAF